MSIPAENGTPAPAVSHPGLQAEIIIPVHNRREITLRCLAALEELGVTRWAGVIVVDDGSTDGTSQAIQARHPGVTVLPGSGQLWWTGAIVLGMSHALARGAELIFWLNDDCIPCPGSLELLAQHAAKRQGVAVGQAFTPSGGRYGAYLRTSSGLRAIQAKAGEILACDTFCGNCACFARVAVEKVGLPDARHFPQTYGDSDYGLRLSQNHLPVEVLGDAVCKNDDNVYIVSKSWLLSPEPASKIFASFFHPRSNVYPPALFHYMWRHWGWPGLFLFLKPFLKYGCYCLLRLLVPRRWLLAWAGSRSAAWRRESFKGG